MNAKRIITMLLALVMVLSLAACGAPSTAPAATEAPAAAESTEAEAVVEETASGKYLVWNIGGEPKTWDPQLNTASSGGHVILNLYDGLVRDTLDGV